MIFVTYWHTAIYCLILWITLVKTIGTHTLPNLGPVTLVPLIVLLFILDFNIKSNLPFLLKPVPYFVVSLPYVFIFFRLELKQAAKAVFIAEGIMILFKLLFALSCLL